MMPSQRDNYSKSTIKAAAAAGAGTDNQDQSRRRTKSKSTTATTTTTTMTTTHSSSLNFTPSSESQSQDLDSGRYSYKKSRDDDDDDKEEDETLLDDEPSALVRIIGTAKRHNHSHGHHNHHGHHHHHHHHHPQAHFNRRLLADLAIMGSDEDPKEYDRLRQLFKHGLIAAEIVGLTMCLLIILWTTVYADGIWFLGSGDVHVINLHVVLMLIFMLYLHGHAALIYRIFPTQPKYTVKLLHGLIHLTTCVGIGCGFAAAIEQHNIKGAHHFYSLHSWLGLAAIVLYYLQFLGGFLTFLLPYASMSIRTSILPYHRFTGQILFSLATGSAITGIILKATGSIGADYPNSPPTAIVLNTTGFLTLTYSVIIGNLLGDARFRRRPRPEGELLLADTHATTVPRQSAE